MEIKNIFNKEDSNRIFIILFTIAVSSVFAIVYIISRIGFEDIHKEMVLKTLLLSYFIILFPYILIRFLQISKFKSLKFITGLESILTLIVILFVTLVGFLKGYVSFNLLWVFIIFGGLFLVFLLFDCKLNYNAGYPKLLVTAIILGFILGLIGILWGSGYSNPLFYPEGIYPEGIIKINSNEHIWTIHIDTLFHASITNMIETYSIPSTGIDGLVRTSYHFGSHWIFAQLSRLLDIGALNFYQVGYSIIFLPLLLKSILMAILDIKSLYKKEDIFNINKDFIFWGILSFGFIGILPQVLKLSYKNSLIGSESYLVSFIFTFLLISSLIFFENEKYPKRINWLKNIFFIIVLPIFIGVIGICKVSLMVISVAVLLYLFFRKQYYKKILYIFSVINILIISLITFFSVTSPSNIYSGGINLSISNLVPYNGENITIYVFNIITFLISIFFWPLAFILLKTISLKTRKLSFLTYNFNSYKTLEIEIILVICAMGILPCLLIYTPGAFYFYDIQRWFAIIFILGSINSKEVLNRARIIVWGGLKEKSISVIKVLIISVLAMVFILNSFHPMYKYLQFNHYIRKDITGYLFEENKEILLAKYKLIKILKKLENLPIEEKRKTVIYVPQSNKIYWDLPLHKGEKKCIANPFLVPATTGIAMIDGLPEYGCDQTDYYGYADYKPRQSSKDYDIKIIYEKAQNKGFTNLIVIDSKDYELFIVNVNSDNIDEIMN